MTAKLRELLNASDEDLFTGGGCHIYAVKLKDCWPQLKIKRAGNAYSFGNAPKARHVYGVVGEFKVDVRGPDNEATYLKSKAYTAWETFVDELTKIDPDRPSENGPLNRWRHYLDPEFVSCASERAQRHIKAHLQQWRSMLVSKQ